MFRSTFLFPARRLAALVSGSLVLSLTVSNTAVAASSWSPTLLVNTESFQRIDQGDGTTSVDLQFGLTTQTIKFLTTNKFQFSHSISVLGTISGSSLNVDRNATIGGTLTASGATNLRSTLTVQGNGSFKSNLSGTSLTIDQSATISGSLMVKTAITSKGSLSGATFYGANLGTCTAANQALRYDKATGKFSCGTVAANWSNTGALQGAFDTRFVRRAGSTMTGNLVIRSTSGANAVNLNVVGGISGASLRVSGAGAIHGPLAISGAVRVDDNLTINDDIGAVDAVFTFGNASGNQNITFSNTLQKFRVSTAVSVLGNLSGTSLTVDQNATVGGTVTARNVLASIAITGAHLNATSTFAGAGLSTCSGATSKLLWNSTTKTFSCGADLNTTAWSNTGSLQGAFDARYVNTSGDTMTGGLVINLSSGTLGLNVRQTISGQTLRVGVGGADIQGALNASGSIRTDGDLTLGADDAATNVILTFMNSGTDGTLTWLDSFDRFQFSHGISVLGTISGSSLNVDRNATIGGTLTASGATNLRSTLTVQGNGSFKSNLSGTSLTIDQSATISGSLMVKTAITSKGSLSGATFYGAGLGTCTAVGQSLQYDKATGKFSCASNAIGNSSGSILSLHPEYPNAIYFASGSNTVGQMTLSGGTTALENSYVWTSTRSTIQDYWISVRVRLPDNFGSWDTVKPLQLRYKTGTADDGNNHLTVRVRDTAGALVTLTSANDLVSSTWTTANITGPQASGTWTPKGYITIYVKLSAMNAAGANAAAGFLNLNFETTTP